VICSTGKFWKVTMKRVKSMIRSALKIMKFLQK